MPTRTTRPTRRTATPTAPIPTPTALTRSALARCVEPVEAPDFLAGYWEQKPLVVHRQEPGRFSDLLSPADVEWLICSSAIRFPAFRLVREGAVLEPSSYTVDVGWSPVPFSGTIDVDRVLAEFVDGATIV